VDEHYAGSVSDGDRGGGGKLFLTVGMMSTAAEYTNLAANVR
jgi:hypothetical protein